MSSEDTLPGPDFLPPPSPYAPASVSRVPRSPPEPLQAVKMAALALVGQALPAGGESHVFAVLLLSKRIYFNRNFTACSWQRWPADMAVSRLRFAIFKKPLGLAGDFRSPLGTTWVVEDAAVEDAAASNGAWPAPAVPAALAQVELPKERCSSTRLGLRDTGDLSPGSGRCSAAPAPQQHREEVASGSSGRLPAAGDRGPHLLTQPGI